MSSVSVQVEGKRDGLMLRYYEPMSSFPLMHERRSALTELELLRQGYIILHCPGCHKAEALFKPLERRPSGFISDYKIPYSCTNCKHVIRF